MPEWEEPTELPSKPRRRAPRAVVTVEDRRSIERQWPAATRLVMVEGDELKLTQQLASIRALLSTTFAAMRVELLLSNPFPDTITRDKMIKGVMRDVAKDRGHECEEILARLREDSDYATTLSIPVSYLTYSLRPTDNSFNRFVTASPSSALKSKPHV
jgi:hypothetical protein